MKKIVVEPDFGIGFKEWSEGESVVQQLYLSIFYLINYNFLFLNFKKWIWILNSRSQKR